MNRNATGISLANPPAIHVGPIVNPSTNETISIVIPLSAQLATVSNEKLEKSCKDCKEKPTRRNDKTKGCPFPTCCRYGRAFSRAHDLKRHIARHEMRKEKLAERSNGNGSAEREERRCDEEERGTKSFSCPQCKRKYTSESKFKAHLITHEKVLEKNTCLLCGTNLHTEEELRDHIKQHTIFQTTVEKTSQKDQTEKEEDFLLEEMLLLNKNPRNTNNSKIRCDYCSKTFKTKWTLSSHVAAHEGRFQFNCNQCGKKFVRKSHFEGHVRSHEATRPYICEQCGKTFKELKHRREHTKRKHPVSQSNAIQNLLDSIGTEELSADQTKFTLLMPANFST